MPQSTLFERIKDRQREKNAKDDAIIKVCAPMVRYSKLAFRHLVRLYDCDLCYTPMILADTFANSEKARHNEFTTSAADRPLIVQFAAANVDDFVAAARLAEPFCDGVGLNCGCPQRWAWQEGIGACLMHKPQMVHDLVRQTRNRTRDDLSVSVKIRTHNDPKETIEFCRQMEAAGIDHLNVHGRTKDQRAEPVNWPLVKEIVDSLSVPVIANGDVKTLAQSNAICAETGAAGVMSARGLLENPALFAGHAETPAECVAAWVRLALETGTHFTCFHHHLIYMCERILPRAERRVFNSLGSTSAVVEFLEEKCGIKVL